ncbi:hypothetical protein MP638_001991 [Amoeboaphelidium occidentale]|nr:hypothetical protein MP638_001991 [Amoeboaphelidium occidentale]
MDTSGRYQNQQTSAGSQVSGLGQATRAKSRKGQQANHLLQFTLPPRPKPQPTRRYQSNTSSYTPYNKERFVHANFRFVISCQQDIYSLDPDAVVPWQHVEQVIMPTRLSTEHQCPICLYPPVAAQMGRCGHVLCYGCALHYLSMSEKPMRSCPLCSERISIGDLRSVLFWSVKDYMAKSDQNGHAVPSTSTERAGSDYMVMKLMQRSNQSLTTLPRYAFQNFTKTLPSMKSLPVVHGSSTEDMMLFTFAKIMLASPEYILNEIITKEMVILSSNIEEAKRSGDSEEISYLEMAMERVKAREKALYSKSPKLKAVSPIPFGKTQKKEAQSVPNEDILLDDFQLVPAIVGEDPFSDITHDETSSSAISEESSSEDEKKPDALVCQVATEEELKVVGSDLKLLSSSPITPFDGMYYFYQSADGQPIYLHPLDVKILKSEYSSYSNFPDEICVKVSTITDSILTEDLRKRYKYLCHLPLSIELSFVEIDWGLSQNGKHVATKNNVCRKSVTLSNAVSPLGSPSLFTGKAGQEKFESQPLISEASIRQWQSEIKFRMSKHVKKAKKEEREARKSKSKGGLVSENTSSTLPIAIPSFRESSQEDVFNFEDENLWPKTPVTTQTLPSTLNAGGSSASKVLSTSPGTTEMDITGQSPMSFAAVLRSKEPISLTQQIQAAKAESEVSVGPKRKGKRKPVVVLMSSGGR